MMPLIIEKLYAWISEDDDGQQGVIAFTPAFNAMTLPLVGADMARIESFRPYIEKIAEESKKKILLMEFSSMKVLEVIGVQSEIQS